GPYRVRADSEQSRDVYACDLARPTVLIPRLTIEAYEGRVRALADTRAVLRDCSAMIS
ncbi:hypothetical protein Pmar_PMAR018220, partial [Perkinsus marinus ATCC 50983]